MAIPASYAASGRQICLFPDGERRVVLQELASAFGNSVSDCAPWPSARGSASESRNPELRSVEAGHEVEPTFREVPLDRGYVPTYREIVSAFGRGMPMPSAPMRDIRAPVSSIRVDPSGSKSTWMPSILRSGGNINGNGNNTQAPIEYQMLIARSARDHGVDPQIVEAVMYVESHFQARAQSNKGAVGLMQLMPQTAQQYGVNSNARLFDPATNIECGTRYLGELTTYFAGRLDLAIAAYNAGPGAVVKYGWRIPPFAETQAYVERVLQRMNAVR